MPQKEESDTLPQHVIVCNTPSCGGKIILNLDEHGHFECPNKCGFEVDKA